jgi:hypothetical protein
LNMIEFRRFLYHGRLRSMGGPGAWEAQELQDKGQASAAGVKSEGLLPRLVVPPLVQKPEQSHRSNNCVDR